MVSRRGISGKRWLDLNEDRYLFKNGQPKFNKYNQIIVMWPIYGCRYNEEELFIYLFMNAKDSVKEEQNSSQNTI